ncbi:MAG: DegT/DnrJ/EryC1/StrS family aminotransferase [Pseudomonadota bacterium]
MKVAFNNLASHPGLTKRQILDIFSNVVRDQNSLFGPQVRRFEATFADYSGYKHVISTANGTDSLELALRAVGVGTGDQVLTVANAGGYATIATRAIGANTFFCDVEPDNGLIALSKLKSALQDRPSALVITHLYGRMVNMQQVFALTDECRIPVIEDFAQSHGARLAGKPVGDYPNIASCMHLACFSFYPTKNLAALGDAGAVATNQPDLAKKIRALAQYGWNEKYQVEFDTGRNSRMDEIQAGILNARLEFLDSNNKIRREIAKKYRNGIQNHKIKCDSESGGYDVEHLFILQSSQRNRLIQHLTECQIETSIHYPIPDHQQRAWRQDFRKVNLPVTEKRAAEILSIPCHPGLKEHEVDYVIRCCNQF